MQNDFLKQMRARDLAQQAQGAGQNKPGSVSNQTLKQRRAQDLAVQNRNQAAPSGAAGSKFFSPDSLLEQMGKARKNLEDRQSAYEKADGELQTAFSSAQEKRKKIDLLEGRLSSRYGLEQLGILKNEYNAEVEKLGELQSAALNAYSDYQSSFNAMSRLQGEYQKWKGTIRRGMSANEVQELNREKEGLQKVNAQLTRDMAQVGSFGNAGFQQQIEKNLARIRQIDGELSNTPQADAVKAEEKARDISREIEGLSRVNRQLERDGASMATVGAANAIRNQIQANTARIRELERDLQQARRSAATAKDEARWNDYFRYADRMEEADFDRLSKYRTTAKDNGSAMNDFASRMQAIVNGQQVEEGAADRSDGSGYGDLIYDYINRDPEAVRIQKGKNRTADLSFLEEMDDEEISIYNYLYAKEGARSAADYLKHIQSNLNERRRARVEGMVSEQAAQNPVAASALSVMLAPVKGLSYLKQGAQMLSRGKIDENAGYNAPSTVSTAIRNAVGQKAQDKWGPVGSFLYETGMSMGDFLMTGAMSLGSPALALGVMGSGAAADTTIAAKDRGLSDKQAFTLGTVAGLAEIITEKISIDTLLDKTSLGKSARGYILKNMAAEGGEEVASELMNLAADVIVSRDKSQWQQSIDAYVADGKSREQAFALAVADQAGSLIGAGIGGALSGGVMGAGAVVLNKGRSPEAPDVRVPEGEQVAPAAAPEEVRKTQEASYDASLLRQTRDQIVDSMGAQLRTVEDDRYLRRLSSAETDLQISGVLAGAEDAQIESAQRLSDVLGKRILFEPADKSRNGWYKRGEDIIYLNPKSANPVAQVIGHELTHSIEVSTEDYGALQRLVQERIRKTGGNLDAMREQKIDLYAKNDVTISQAQADREIVAEYIEKNLLTDEQAIGEMVRDNRSLARRILDWLDGLLAKFGNKKSQERQFVLQARDAYRKALQQSYGIHERNQMQQARAQAYAEGDDAAGDAMFDDQWGEEGYVDRMLEDDLGDTQFAISRTEENRPFVIVERDILDGVPESEWIQTVKNNLKEKFPHGVQVGRNVININKQSRNELTRSNKTVRMAKKDPQTYSDKFRATDNADEVLLASTGWVNEGLNHERSDTIRDFARGDVLIRVGKNDYDADVIVGTKEDGTMMLYEIVNMKPTTISEKKQAQGNTANAQNGLRSSLAPTTDIITRNGQGVKADPLQNNAGTGSEQQLPMEKEVQFSLANDAAFMDRAILMNQRLMRTDDGALRAAGAVRARIADRMNAIKDRGLVGLPEDIEGNTYIANSSYDGTEENTTICPRSLAAEAFVDAVSEYLGRPLRVEEQIYISQDLQGRSLTPECTYCYVATDRKAYRAFLGEYIRQRDAVIDKLREKPEMDSSKLLRDHNALKNDPKVELSELGEMYRDFLNGRKPTDPMYKRFKMWVDAYRNGTPMIQAGHLANISKLMGDINSEFGAELKPQIVDAMKYAQSASWAKKRINYVAYNGHILKWKQDRINKLNGHYGLRMYSFSDFHPAFVLENMQMITDASVRGLKMLGYTKDTDFVEIFAPTGMNINVSTFGFNAGGEVFENNLIGAEWEKAKQLREQYPNVGVNFVATNDTLVNWALEQDWIDVVIPFHLVRTGTEVAEAFKYTNYTSESSDTKDVDWAKGTDQKYIAPTEHNNDKATYLAALKRNHLKPRFERFIDHPNYMKLVNECRQSASQSRPVQPVFNEDAAMVALAKLEVNGYYQPIGGSVDRMYEIAAEVAERGVQTGWKLEDDAQYSISEETGEEAPDPVEMLPGKVRSNVVRYENEMVRVAGTSLGVAHGEARGYLKTMAREISREYLQTGQVSQEAIERLAEEAWQQNPKKYDGPDAERFKRWEKDGFVEAAEKLVGELEGVKHYLDKQAEIQKKQLESPVSQEEATALYPKLKEARRNYEKVMARTLLTDEDQKQVSRLLRGDIELQHLKPGVDNVTGIRKVYEAKLEYEKYAKQIRQWNRSRKARLMQEAAEYTESANAWKDKRMGIAYSRETMERNIRDIVPDKELAERIIDTYIKPVHEGAANANRTKNKYRDRIRALNLSQKAEGEHVSEAYAVQLLGEAEDNIRFLERSRGRIKHRDGKTIDEWQAAINDLWTENPQLDQAKIRGAVEEFRKIYDELFQQMNEARIRNGYEPVNYRQGYFPHFQAKEEEGIMAQFGKALGIKTEVTALPTSINGLTHTFKPGIRWMGNALERKGFETAYDALEGFDRYIEGVADVIHQTDNIQRLRALEAQARYRTTDEGIRQQIDAVRARDDLSEIDKENRIKEIYENARYALSNFVVELEEYTNLLANKKSRADRNMEQAMGRDMYNLVKSLESRVAANMVAINPGSWLTNFIPLTQGAATLDKGLIWQGMFDTLKAIKNDDGFVDSSSFLVNRRGSDPLVQTWQQKASAKMSKPMEIIDSFTADSLVRARFKQNVSRGMSDAAAIEEADQWAAGVMADRSKGSTPTLFNRSNPLTKLFTQFQLEVNNQLSYVFKDIPREAGERDKYLAALALMLFKFAIGAFFYNEAYEYVIGRRPALDPLGILNDTVGDITGFELPNMVEYITGEDRDLRTQKVKGHEAAANLATNVLEEVPFIGGLMGGGRLPISSALPDWENLSKAAFNDEWSPEKRLATAASEMANPLTYLALPFGGGQLKKLWQGAQAAIKGGSYTVDSEGNDILQYPVYADETMNALRAMVFGKTTVPTGVDWIESGFKNLSAKATAAYQGMMEEGVPNRDAYELVKAMSEAKKTGVRSADDIRRSLLRSSDISDAGKAVAYYMLLANDKERLLMDELEGSGADIGAIVNALMDIREGKTKNDQLSVLMKSGLDEESYEAVVGHIMGTELTTDKGNSTQYADYLDSVKAGLEPAEALQMQQDGIDLADFVKLTDAGMSPNLAASLVNEIHELKPEEGSDRVTDIQKWRAACNASTDPDEQMAALEMVMEKSAYKKLTIGYDHGVDPAAYVRLREILPQYDANGSGSYSHDEIEAAIEGMSASGLVMAGGDGTIFYLTAAQKAALWQLFSTSSSAKNNPYDTDTGWAVIEAKKAE